MIIIKNVFVTINTPVAAYCHVILSSGCNALKLLRDIKAVFLHNAFRFMVRRFKDGHVLFVFFL